MQNLNQSGGAMPPFLCVKHLPTVYKILNEIEGKPLTDISSDTYQSILEFLESVQIEGGVFESIHKFFEFIKPLYECQLLPDLQTEISNKRLNNLRAQLAEETDKDKRLEIKNTINSAENANRPNELIQQQTDALTALYGEETAQVMQWVIYSKIPLERALNLPFKQFVDEYNINVLKNNIEYSHHLEEKNKEAQQEAIRQAQGRR
ncbi:hypothetical protein [Vibrio casei]|uniref:hypothetical protein n=1 Tax=Vibrio casei TaxID=673372 RepID=UPI000B5CE1B3|nr:hypothetical protein [Vibrio casei]